MVESEEGAFLPTVISDFVLNKNAWQKKSRSASDLLLAPFIENCRELTYHTCNCHCRLLPQLNIRDFELMSIHAFSGILSLTSTCSSHSISSYFERNTII